MAGITSRLTLPTSIPAALFVGAAAGALWGVVARLWMRFISAEYEFTWNGTVAIVMIFAIFGLGQAVAAVVRRSGRGQGAQIAGRTVAIATTLPMGMAAGPRCCHRRSWQPSPWGGWACARLPASHWLAWR